MTTSGDFPQCIAVAFSARCNLHQDLVSLKITQMQSNYREKLSRKNVRTSVKTRRMGMCFRDFKLFRYIDSHTNTRNHTHRNVEVKMVGVRS